MNQSLFEKIIVTHCAPTLAGIKPANLVSFSKTDYPYLSLIARSYSSLHKDDDLCFEVICECRRHNLLLVYRPSLLKDQLNNPKVISFLIKCGYPDTHSLARILGYLKQRLSCGDSFPHEIGIFLGYPIEDVKGFQKFRGKECKFCGYWKVYGDVASAKELFHRFDQCRDLFTDYIKAGYTISQLLFAAKQYRLA